MNKKGNGVKYIYGCELDPIDIIKSEILDRIDININNLTMKDVKNLRDAADKIEITMKEHNTPLLDIYPNKFKLITGIDQIYGDGLYYINSNIPEDLIQPISDWISNILEIQDITFAGFKRGSISYSDFCNEYNYDIRKLNYKLGDSLAEMDYYYGEYEVNPIRFINDQIVLWGEIIRGCKIGDLLLTVTNAAVVMSVLNILIQKGMDPMDRHLVKLMQCGIIYSFPNWQDETHITFAKCAKPYILNTEDIEKAKHDLNYLKRCLIKGDI